MIFCACWPASPTLTRRVKQRFMQVFPCQWSILKGNSNYCFSEQIDCSRISVALDTRLSVEEKPVETGLCKLIAQINICLFFFPWIFCVTFRCKPSYFLTLITRRSVLKVCQRPLCLAYDLNVCRENEFGSVFWLPDTTESIQGFLHMFNSTVNA